MELDHPSLVRESVLQGIFYPESARHLREAVQRLLLEAHTPACHASAIMVPHGSFAYSGKLAAEAYKAVCARTVDLVIILGCSAWELAAPAVLPESVAYRTPLGAVPVACREARRLESCSPHFLRDDLPHLEAPTVETQLPFLQFLFPGASILPVLVGRLTHEKLHHVARALSQLAERRGPNLLWIASSHLTPCGPLDQTRRSAEEAVRTILAGDWHRLVDIRQGRCDELTAPALLISAGMAAYSPSVLSMGNSFRVDGRLEENAEYGAIAWSAP